MAVLFGSKCINTFKTLQASQIIACYAVVAMNAGEASLCVGYAMYCVCFQKERRKSPSIKWYEVKGHDVIKFIHESENENFSFSAESSELTPTARSSGTLWRRASPSGICKDNRNNLADNVASSAGAEKTTKGNAGALVSCASGCGRGALLLEQILADVCETCNQRRNSLCVFAHYGQAGGEQYKSCGAGVFGKLCSLK